MATDTSLRENPTVDSAAPHAERLASAEPRAKNWRLERFAYLSWVDRQRKRSLLRFSIQTMLIFALFLGSVMSVVRCWGPWAVERQVAFVDASADLSKAPICCALSPDRTRVAIGDWNGDVCIYDVASAALQLKLQRQPAILKSATPVSTVDLRVQKLVWSADGRILVSTAGMIVDANALVPTPEPVVFAWDAISGEDKLKNIAPAKRAGIGTSCLADSATIALTKNKKPDLLNVETGVRETLTFARGDCYFTPNGKKLVIAQPDSTMRVLDRGGRELAHGYASEFVSIAPDGLTLLTCGGTTSEICEWELESGRMLRMFSGDRCTFRSASLSPNGQILLARTSSDVVLFDADSTTELARLNTGPSAIDPAFLDNGHIFALHSDGKASIWVCRRAQTSWGVAAMPEFWLAGLLAALLIWSIAQDRSRVVGSLKFNDHLRHSLAEKS